MKHYVLKVIVVNCNINGRKYLTNIIGKNGKSMGVMQLRLAQKDKYFHHQICRYGDGRHKPIYVKLKNFKNKNGHYYGDLVSWNNHDKDYLI